MTRELMHQRMAQVIDGALDRIADIQRDARNAGKVRRPRWPMIVLRSPKGWTGPKEVDGKKVEGFWRAHQVPVEPVKTNPAHLDILETWMRSYRPETLFDSNGCLMPELQALAPVGARRMGANPHANGGTLKRKLELPDYRAHAVEVSIARQPIWRKRRASWATPARRDPVDAETKIFRLMGPDETGFEPSG